MRVAALIGVVLATLPAPAQAGDGVFVLGVDGMDPVILQRMIREGKAPNLAKLAKQGSFDSLGTSYPPQSPVAWSNFVTGMNPGGHGIFDFIHRDPATYLPISSATPPIEDHGEFLEIFGYYIPLGTVEALNNRGGIPFWDLLHEAGVDVEIYRIPGNFPTPPSEAKVLDGMGTVDMRGGYGTYTLLTDRPLDKDDPKGDVQVVSLQDFDLDGVPDSASGVLRGAPDLFHLPPGQAPGDGDYLTARIEVKLDPEHEAAVVEIGSEAVLLAEGEWSEWVEVPFDALPYGMMPLMGTVRVYAKQLRPNLQIYISPVNISPTAPALPVSTPDDFATDIYDSMGYYYTQGMPEETDALKDRVFDDDDYVGQVALVQEDTERMLDMALDRFGPGDATFVYLSDIDLQCHMLWRHNDPKHPDAPVHPAMDDLGAAARHALDIEGYYADVDHLVGKTMEAVPEGTMVMVMSDHGFQPYTRKVHLNAWLRDNGYLALKEGARTGQIAIGDVDWSKTKAYGLGFNGLYLNIEGREAEGIVPPGKVDALAAELTQALTRWVDPERDANIVLEVVRSDEVYSGDRIAEAPDLIVGYDRNYGASDESTLGEITEGVLEDNTGRWSGNHLMSPRVVPGVVLVNRAIRQGDHDLTDLTATLLAHYGLPLAPGMVGESILRP